MRKSWKVMAFLLAMLQGCAAPPIQLSRSQLDSIESVSVSPRITQEGVDISSTGRQRDTLVGTSRQTANYFGGGLIGAIAEAAARRHKDCLALGESLGVSVPELLVEQYGATLRGDPAWAPKLAESAKHEFQIELLACTMQAKGLISDLYRPFVAIKVRLLSADGSELSHAAGSNPLFFAERWHTLDEFKRDPALFRAEVAQAIRLASLETLGAK